MMIELQAGYYKDLRIRTLRNISCYSTMQWFQFGGTTGGPGMKKFIKRV